MQGTKLHNRKIIMWWMVQQVRQSKDILYVCKGFLYLTKIRILLCYNPTSIQYSMRSWSTTTIVKKRFKTLDNFKKIEKFNLKFAK